MSKVKVKPNTRAITELLNSRGVQADLLARAERIAAAAGEGFVAGVEAGPNRARAWVVTATAQAMNGEAKDRRLSVAMQAGA